MKGLTRRQREVLEFIDSSVHSNGYPPSVREIAAQFHLVSASGVHKHIKALVKKKFLSKQDFTSRSLRVLRRHSGSSGTDSVSLQVLDAMPPGHPQAAGAASQAGAVPLVLVGQQEGGTLIMRLKGDAMIEEGFCDGDYLIVEPRTAIRDGEMAVVQLPGGETTVKRVYRDGEELRLQSANARLPAARIQASQAQIQGAVITVWRRYT